MEEFKIRCQSQHQSRFVEKRDQGICQICRRDTVKAEADYNRLGVKWKSSKNHEEREANQEAVQASLRIFGNARGNWREVDHIIPVCQGGGLCGPENLRLVCGACHLDVTNRLAAERKAE